MSDAKRFLLVNPNIVFVQVFQALTDFQTSFQAHLQQRMARQVSFLGKVTEELKDTGRHVSFDHCPLGKHEVLIQPRFALVNVVKNKDFLFSSAQTR